MTHGISSDLLQNQTFINHTNNNLAGTETLTYYIHDVSNYFYSVGDGYANTYYHTATEESYIESVFSSIDPIIDLDFERVYSDNGSDIDIYCLSSHTSWDYGVVGQVWDQGWGQYSWWDVGWKYTGNWQNDRNTIVHEIGHALGLSHPDNSGFNPNYDSSDTVMSYNQGPSGWSTAWTESDKNTLIEIWGVEDDNVVPTTTTYSYNSSTSVTSIVQNWFSYSASNQQTDVNSSNLSISTISWSDTISINRVIRASDAGGLVQAMQANTATNRNADPKEGSIILGGNANDTIRGLASWDVLDGSGGNDLIHGGNGKDVITGSTGEDELHGDFGWNTYRSEKDGYKDLIAIKSDQFLSNWMYGKAGNSPNGEKADFIEGLDTIDQIKIIGVMDSDLTYASTTHRGVAGIGIYAAGTLEALYTAGDLSISQLSSMTSGDSSTRAMNNQVWSYWGSDSIPDLLS